MTIHYNNGESHEAILLVRTESSMRVQIRGSADTTELRETEGRWIADSGEPVDIEFAWMRKAEEPSSRVEDYVCPQELAARMIEMLLAGDEAGEATPAKVSVAGGAA
jgi:hypothetical protein